MKQIHTYAYTTSSKQNQIQSISIYLNVLDNDPQHFWVSFIESLITWNDFAQDIKQFPFKENEKNLFMNNFITQLHTNPLVIIFHNYQRISNNSIRMFINDLLDIPFKYLYLMLLYNEPSITEKNNDYAKFYYLTKQEEWSFYNQYSINLSEDQLNNIRIYTNGWLAAVQKCSLHIPLDKVLQENKLEDTIIYNFEIFFHNECTESQQELMILLSLLKEFPLELIRKLSEKKDIVFEPWFWYPFIRYNSDTAQFYYAEILVPYLEKKQMLLSNHQKEWFYITVGNWYKECNNKIMAIYYYRMAHDYKKAIQIIQQLTFPSSAEMANCCIETINEMPADMLDKHPLLYIIRCYMLNNLYRFNDSYNLIKVFCSQNIHEVKTSLRSSAILGEAYLFQGITSILLCLDSSESFMCIKQAAALLPQGSNILRCQKINIYADIPAIRLLAPEPGFLKSYSDFLFQCEPYISQATGVNWQGSAYLAAAEMNFYTRNFKMVETNAYNAINMAVKNNQSDIICSSYFLLMRYHMAKGNYDRIIENFELLKQHAKMADFKTFFSMPDLAISWLMLYLDKHNEVAGWIKHENQYRSKIRPWNYGRDRVVRCLYLLHSQRFDETAAYADISSKLMSERGLHILRIQLLVIKSIAYHKMKRAELSVRTFEEVYRWTYKNQIVMPIIELGKYIRPLIENCLKTDDCTIPEKWLKEIGKKANTYYIYQHNIQKKYNQSDFEKNNILNRLTNTERELLQLICQGIKMNTIAEMQGKSVSAVKGICRQIYTKLNVRNRVDAVRIATISEIESKQSKLTL